MFTFASPIENTPLLRAERQATPCEDIEYPMNHRHGDSTSPYQALTHPVDAKLVLTTGTTQEVTLFLGSRAELHSGPETLDEFLNSRRNFLPVRSKEEDRSFLINREIIQRIEVDESAPVLFHIEEKLTRKVDLVRLELRDGEILEGTLCSARSPDHPRLSDDFNQDLDFIPLEIGSGVTYVNKQHVVMVWL